MRIAVVGAAGYVGMELCRELVGAGHRVVAITRSNGRFLLSSQPIDVRAPSEVGAVGPVDAVVNLAYPNKGSIYSYPAENRRLRDMIATLAASRAHVVHTSTQAVFGFALEQPIAAEPVTRRRDYLYIESKIALERQLLARPSGRSLDIVRLGNVWGPASPTWTAALADKLVFGDPVGVAGRDGFCNATDVANVASYLRYLLECADGSRGARFHHLAELGHLPWSHWVNRIAGALGVVPVRIEAVPGLPSGLREDLRGIWGRHSPFVLAKELFVGRVSGSFMRSAIARIPMGVWARLKTMRNHSEAAHVALPSGLDPVFLTLMACETRFESRTDPGWMPPVSEEESWNRVTQWIERAGFPSPSRELAIV